MIDTPFGRLRVCDTHTHFFTPSFYTNLGKLAGVGADGNLVAQKLGWDAPPATPELVASGWVKELDRHGVDRVVAIHTLPGDAESAGAGISSSAGRLAGYVMINPLADGAMEMLKRAVEEHHFRGVALFPAMFGFDLHADPAYAILDYANQKSLNVFVHCGVLKVGFRTKLGLPSTFDASLASPLLLQKPSAEFPKANFIVPHLGSGLLRELLMVADQVPNIYTDTSGMAGWTRYVEGNPSPASVLRHVLHIMGPHRILFGSDSTFFPRGWRRDIFDLQLALFEEANLSSDQVGQILSGNFDGLLKDQA